MKQKLHIKALNNKSELRKTQIRKKKRKQLQAAYDYINILAVKL